MPNNVIQLSDNPLIDNQSLVQSCKDTLLEQSMEMAKLANSLNQFEFAKTLSLMKHCAGHIIICGMGKSGHVGKKIAATLASTGTPSFFLHPAEAFHGDLGMVTSNDVVILISNSGESDEVLKLIPSLKSFGNSIISITGNPESTLAKNADTNLIINIEKETCPNNLAPTTSTTLTIAIGDALAVALMKARNFMPMDFAKFHPGGSLGRRLLTKVEDVMISNGLCTINIETPLPEVIEKINKSKIGIAIVTDNGYIEGIITDGDIRRNIKTNVNLELVKSKDIMTRALKSIEPGESIDNAFTIMKRHKIKQLVVEKNNILLGIVEHHTQY